MSYKSKSVGATPFSITNDDDTSELRMFIVTLAAATVNLPSAAGFKNARLYIKKRNASAGTITIAPSNSQTINSSASYSLTNDHQFLTIASDGANWHILSSN